VTLGGSYVLGAIIKTFWDGGNLPSPAVALTLVVYFTKAGVKQSSNGGIWLSCLAEVINI
jgi:hypothetical protein